MTENETSAQSYWRPRIKKGKSYFTWRYGVLGWGVPTSIVWSAAMEVWRSGLAEFSIGGYFLYLALSLPLFMIGGYAWARFMWWATIRKSPVH